MVHIYRYPPWGNIASRTDLKKYYESMREEIAGYKQAAQNSSITAKKYQQKADESSKENKTINKRLLTLTKKKKATDEAKKAGYWSGAATIGVTILYETWKVIGFPGGHRWMGWWEHEAVYGVMIWLATCTFGWFYRSSHRE